MGSRQDELGLHDDGAHEVQRGSMEWVDRVLVPVLVRQYIAEFHPPSCSDNLNASAVGLDDTQEPLK